MAKSELIKQYETETGYSKSLGVREYYTGYIEYLESQLTWKPVSEKPKKDGEYIVKFTYPDGEEGIDVCEFKNEKWYWDSIISWLPIPTSY